MHCCVGSGCPSAWTHLRMCISSPWAARPRPPHPSGSSQPRAELPVCMCTHTGVCVPVSASHMVLVCVSATVPACPTLSFPGCDQRWVLCVRINTFFGAWCGVASCRFSGAQTKPSDHASCSAETDGIQSLGSASWSGCFTGPAAACVSWNQGCSNPRCVAAAGTFGGFLLRINS